ncbi:thiamine-phosphate pyrophosphorylase [Gracilibacillus orientalis]|uniref:Thiamine-phosphate synthase n=1 Tax=Gracilibacillus orientalis TaxID=334253 RepID=A0A1I4LXV4_9BACI|nr:thiamine phosphate synthase [Gracilibacillus orientalis]SFL95547.1 thiamine-phosphate pyrophosphorylase [Gracilibacillus orientalis]
MERNLLQVYFILGSNNTEGDPLYVLEEALKGGVTLFQFREKGHSALQGEDKKQLAMQMKELCHLYHVPFLVNDDIELALEIEADGVHVGQDDMSIDEVRKVIPNNWVVGVSSTKIKEAVQAKKDGADYIGVGPIYSTNTKEDAKKPIGAEGLQDIRKRVGDLPIVAIGGIHLGHVIRLMQAGADGVSVISAISQSVNPQTTAGTFLNHANYFARMQ